MNHFIHIEKTNYSPEVTFNPKDTISFIGELRMEHPKAFFTNVKETINTYLASSNTLKINDLKLIFKLEYIGSSNSLELFNFIKYAQNKNMKLIWEYESIDEDLAELGDIIKTGYASEITLRELS